MREQHHRIKRQTIEIQVADEPQARLLQEQVSQIYRWRIVPIIDQICSELSSPHQLHQLDRVEIDLGAIDPKNLEQSMLAKIEPALRGALATQIDEQSRLEERQDWERPSQSQLTLLATFLRTGTVPWWVDATEPALLSECVEHLLQNSADPLRSALPRWLRSADVRRRLVLYIDADRLDHLVLLLRPELKAFLARDLPALVFLLQQFEGLRQRSRGQIQRLLIECLLLLLADQPRFEGGFHPWLHHALLVRLAAENDLTADSLLHDLADRAASAPTDAVPVQVREALERAVAPAPTRSAAMVPPKLWRELRELTTLMPESRQSEWMYTLTKLEATDRTVQRASTIEQVLALMRASLAGPTSARDMSRSAEDGPPTSLSDRERAALRAALLRISAQAAALGWPTRQLSELNQLPSALVSAAQSSVAPRADNQAGRIDDQAEIAAVSLWHELRELTTLMPESRQSEWMYILTKLEATDRTAQRASTIEQLLTLIRATLAGPTADTSMSRVAGDAPPTVLSDQEREMVRAALLRISAQAATLDWSTEQLGEMNQLLSPLVSAAQSSVTPRADNQAGRIDDQVEMAAASLWRELRDLAALMPDSRQSDWLRTLAKLQRADPTFQHAATIEQVLTLLRKQLPQRSSPPSSGRGEEAAGPAARDAQALAALHTVVRHLLAGATDAGWSAGAIGELNRLLARFIDAIEPDLDPGHDDKITADPDALSETVIPISSQDRANSDVAYEEMISPQSNEMEPNDLEIDFDDIEEIYIHNTGLVMLWPFLGPFFENLALMDEGQFVDFAAQQRAIGLLHAIAAGEDEPQEYQTSLNKVLCGLPLTDVFDFGPPLSADEREASDDLLRAVIVQAPVLGEMSPDGLRNTFLQRGGILRSRDGSWLLQVERETYDVVLDRIPWSWQWVRLPWMDTPLQVEW